MVRGQKNCPTVVRTSELEEIGLARRTIYQRCLPGGPWRRLLPGVILLNSGVPSDRQRIDAALLRGGSDAMVTGLWAARSYGLRRTPEPAEVHLLVPAEREVTSVGFALVERTIRLPPPVQLHGIPIAPAERAVLDAARRMRDFDDIRAMLAEAVQRGRCRPEVLARELQLGSQRGSALPRRAIIELLAGARSVAEGDALHIWKRAGLPEAEWNKPVYDEYGVYVGTPDAWLDSVAFAWEIDSREFHFEIAGYARTLARNARYSAAGVVVLQTLPIRLRTEPDAVINELRAAYAAAQRRPRPPLRLG
nr:hypothetical protein [Amycolatopsis palatopharyngis]